MQTPEAALSHRVPSLTDEKPILAYPKVAHALGVNEAIILQQIYFYINVNRRKKSKQHFHDGQWWVYNSYKQWRDQHFPWLTARGVQNIILKLEAKGLLISRQGLDNPQDRRKWYSIDLDKLAALIPTSKSHSAQTARPTFTDCTSNVHEMVDDSSDINTENSQKEKRESASATPADATSTITPDGDSFSEDKSVEETSTPQTDFAVKAQNNTALPRSDVKQPVKGLPQSAQGGGAHPMRAVIEYSFNGSEGLTGRLSGFFAGTLKDHPQQRAWAQTQPTERPATPQEVVALALWYSRSPDYSRSYAERKGLPKTPSVLRERLDEFRGSVGYDKAMSLAGPIVERLLKGERFRLEPVSEVKPAPMPQRVEAAQAYKPISPIRDAAYLDRRQPGDLELAAKLFGA